MTPTPPKRLDRDLSAEKTEAILKGAMQEFLTHGYAATSMDKVAAAAGVSKATVYSHFQDKEGLFKALIQQLAQKKTSGIFGPGKQKLQGEPRLVLRQLATNMLNTTMQDQEFLAFVRLIIGESGRFPELARAFVYTFDQAGGRMLADYFATRSELKIADPEATARVMVGALVHFMIAQEMMHGKDIVPLEHDRLVTSLVTLITGASEAQE
jgi:TetR/AcrR family transcriptional regulator of autoinduction and epiphytic fitness